MLQESHFHSGSGILVPVDVEFYWFSSDISLIKIFILSFATKQYEVRHVMFVTACVLASMKKNTCGGSVGKIYDLQNYL